MVDIGKGRWRIFIKKTWFLGLFLGLVGVKPSLVFITMYSYDFMNPQTMENEIFFM